MLLSNLSYSLAAQLDWSRLNSNVSPVVHEKRESAFQSRDNDVAEGIKVTNNSRNALGKNVRLYGERLGVCPSQH